VYNSNGKPPKINAPWAVSQPNGNKRENCLTTFKLDNNPRPMWYDRSCLQRNGYKFMCECNVPAPTTTTTAKTQQNSQQSSNKNSGLWKPNSDNEECGTRISLTNIVGGKTAKRGDYPFIALIGYDPPLAPGSDIFYTCGGSLINKHYVLTAAHCIETVNGRPVEVVLGEHRVDTDPDCSRDGKCSPPKITRGIKEIIMHESYDEEPAFNHDIALIRLDQEVPLNSEDPKNSWVLPVCLPWAKDDFYRKQLPDGEKATVAGWGRNVRKKTEQTIRRVNRNRVNVKLLLSVEVPIANGKCGTGDEIEIDTRRQICAGGEEGK